MKNILYSLTLLASLIFSLDLPLLAGAELIGLRVYDEKDFGRVVFTLDRNVFSEIEAKADSHLICVRFPDTGIGSLGKQVFLYENNPHLEAITFTSSDNGSAAARIKARNYFELREYRLENPNRLVLDIHRSNTNRQENRSKQEDSRSFNSGSLSYYSLGIQQINNRQSHAALESFRKAIEAGDHVADSYFQAGVIRFQLGHYQIARANLSSALSGAESGTKARLYLCWLYFKTKNYAEFHGSWNKLTALLPDRDSRIRTAMLFPEINYEAMALLAQGGNVLRVEKTLSDDTATQEQPVSIREDTTPDTGTPIAADNDQVALPETVADEQQPVIENSAEITPAPDTAAPEKHSAETPIPSTEKPGTIENNLSPAPEPEPAPATMPEIIASEKQPVIENGMEIAIIPDTTVKTAGQQTLSTLKDEAISTGTDPNPEPAEASGKTSDSGQEGYLLGNGDIVRINVLDETDLSGLFQVSSTGKISYPFLGNIDVRGMTAEGLNRFITDELKKNYLVNPIVTLNIESYKSKKVLIQGEVVKPGIYYLKAKTGVLDLLLEAGGTNKNASEEIIILRSFENNSEVTDTSKEFEQIKINLRNLLSGDPKQNIKARSGDIIFVANASSDQFRAEGRLINIIGEIRKPGSYDYRNGLTILSAILDAGGFTEYANKNKVKIIRKSGPRRIIIIAKLDDLIEKGKLEEDIPLDPGDLIVVPQSLF